MSSFLQELATTRSPTQVADALVDCFGESLGTRMAGLLPSRPPRLVVFALSGYDPAQAQEFDSIAMDADYPSTRAMRRSEIRIDSLVDVYDAYAAMSPHSSRSRRMAELVPVGYSVAAPMVSGGRSVGAYVMVCAGEREWSTLDLAALGTIGHALGTWLTHPDSGLPPEHVPVAPPLTARQATVLSLIAEGRTTHEIAASVGASASTVKVELGHLRQALGAASRADLVARARSLGVLPPDSSEGAAP